MKKAVAVLTPYIEAGKRRTHAGTPAPPAHQNEEVQALPKY
jgi:cobalamin-dependent methionine synthase I